MSERQREALRARVEGSLGQKLLKAARLFNRETIAEVTRRGHALRESHTRLFPYLDFDGTRLTDLAARAGITKQSAQQLVDELAANGYLKRSPDPRDARAKLIVPTKKGLRGVTAGLEALGRVEARVSEHVGKRNMVALERSLDAMLEVLEEADT